jgi:hypothetical protein
MAHRQERKLPWTTGQIIATGMLPVVMAASVYKATRTHMPIEASPDSVKTYERIFDGEIKPIFVEQAGRLIVRSSQLIKVQGYE